LDAGWMRLGPSGDFLRPGDHRTIVADENRHGDLAGELSHIAATRGAVRELDQTVGLSGRDQDAASQHDPAEVFRLEPGDRIAQLVIVALPGVAPGWVEELPPSERGEGGFGSTGRA
jgi:dUTPase